MFLVKLKATDLVLIKKKTVIKFKFCFEKIHEAIGIDIFSSDIFIEGHILPRKEIRESAVSSQHYRT